MSEKAVPDIERTGQTVKCPLCDKHHEVKRTKKGHEFFSCPDIGGGTNVFPRTPLGKAKFKEWAGIVRKHTESKVVPELSNAPTTGGQHDRLGEAAQKLLLRMKKR